MLRRSLSPVSRTSTISLTQTRVSYLCAVFRSFSSFSLRSLRSPVCLRPHTKFNDTGKLPNEFKSRAATSSGFCGFKSHPSHRRPLSMSRNEWKRKSNTVYSDPIGCAASDHAGRGASGIQAAQQVTQLHGWTDPMQDAWAEVWTSTVAPVADAKLAEISREAAVPAQPPTRGTKRGDSPAPAGVPVLDGVPETRFVIVPRKWPQGRLSGSAPDPLRAPPIMPPVMPPMEEQRTPEWFAKREGRLTASAFGNALGLWQSGRTALWEEKIGVGKVFSGNAATRWGTEQEPQALSCYTTVTGNKVQPLSFQVYRPNDPLQDWLGASPDGLLQCDGYGEAVGNGVLEVKCPYNKGNPEEAPLPTQVPSYYMPQAQGLLEIFDREWMDFYIWTLNGSVVFRVERDPKYWALIFPVLSNFWWSHVVPARQLVKEGDIDSIYRFAPPDKDNLTLKIKQENARLVRCARTLWLEENGIVKQLSSGMH